MDRPLKPGSVVFVETPEGVTHRDYVTHAWTRNPVEEVLVKMAAIAGADTGSRLSSAGPTGNSRFIADNSRYFMVEIVMLMAAQFARAGLLARDRAIRCINKNTTAGDASCGKVSIKLNFIPSMAPATA